MKYSLHNVSGLFFVLACCVGTITLLGFSGCRGCKQKNAASGLVKDSVRPTDSTATLQPDTTAAYSVSPGKSLEVQLKTFGAVRVSAEIYAREDETDAYTVLNFSKSDIPSVHISKCLGATLVNVGDVLGNGSDAFVAVKGWFSSDWTSYLLYAFNGKKWYNPIPAQDWWLGYAKRPDPLVAADTKEKGRLAVKYYAMDNQAGCVLRRVYLTPTSE